MRDWVRLALLAAAACVFIFFAAWCRLRIIDARVESVLQERGLQMEPGRDVWQVSVGGGRPPQIQLTSRERSAPEERLRAMVAELLIETCRQAADPPVCVDEIVAEGLARLGESTR